MMVTSRRGSRWKGLCVELHIQWSLGAEALCDAERCCAPTREVCRNGVTEVVAELLAQFLVAPFVVTKR